MTVKLEPMPQRSRGELNVNYYQHRNTIRIDNLELQVQELYKILLKKEKKK